MKFISTIFMFALVCALGASKPTSGSESEECDTKTSVFESVWVDVNNEGNKEYQFNATVTIQCRGPSENSDDTSYEGKMSNIQITSDDQDKVTIKPSDFKAPWKFTRNSNGKITGYTFADSDSQQVRNMKKAATEAHFEKKATPDASSDWRCYYYYYCFIYYGRYYCYIRYRCVYYYG